LATVVLLLLTGMPTAFASIFASAKAQSTSECKSEFR